jgi:hypothetical protein
LEFVPNDVLQYVEEAAIDSAVDMNAMNVDIPNPSSLLKILTKTSG